MKYIYDLKPVVQIEQYYYNMYGAHSNSYKSSPNCSMIPMFLNTEGNREKHTNKCAFLNIFIQFNKQILMQRYKDLSFHTEKYNKDNGI